MEENTRQEQDKPVVLSEEMNEFISSKPGFLLRIGNYITPVLFILLLIICWNVKLPDALTVQGTILSDRPAVAVKAPSPGYLDELQVTKDQLVRRGTVLGDLVPADNADAQVKRSDSLRNVLTLRAPVDGKCIFAGRASVNRFYNANDTILFISPDNPGYFARINIPQGWLAKIKEGQSIQLMFDSYPSGIYGNVHGTISHIDPVSSGGDFTALVDLRPELITSVHKKIQVKEGLKMQARIVTGNNRLLSRMFPFL